MAPVALRIEIAEVELFLAPQAYGGGGASDLAGDERLAAQRAFMVEQDPVGGVHSIGLPVIDHDPVGIELRGGIGRSRIERSAFALRHFLDQAVEFRRRGLVEAAGFLHSEDSDGLQQPKRSKRVRIGSIFGRLEAHHHMALRGEIVDLGRTHFLHDPDQVGGIGEIAIMEMEARMFDMRVFVKMLDAARVER